MNNPFLKRIMKTKKKDIFHSSTFGQVQNGSSLGAASGQSFNQRMSVERNRKLVRGYSDARVLNGAYSSAPKAKKFEVPPKTDKI